MAKIDRFPSLTREKVHEIYIVSTDDLTNQKLVNWRNSGKIEYVEIYFIAIDWSTLSVENIFNGMVDLCKLIKIVSDRYFL